MKNAKYEFLKQYLNSQKKIKFENAWASLSEFYSLLPERTKGRDRKAHYTLLIEQFQNAFEEQLKILANCPFIKIEMNDLVTQQQFQKIIEEFSNDFYRTAGYIMRRIDEVEEKL